MLWRRRAVYDLGHGTVARLAPTMAFPLRPALTLFGLLDAPDRNALVRAYPTLGVAYAKFRARTQSPWQARLPVELVRDIMGYLKPADFFAASCVCAFWRSCAMDARLVREQLDSVLANSYESTADLAAVSPIPENEELERLWLYFVVSAPRRYMFKDGARRYRVTTLGVRRAVSGGRVFLSDYGGIMAVPTSSGLVFYSFEELLPSGCDEPPTGMDLGTLVHPRGVDSSQLEDVSIAHQQGTSGTFQVFALYNGGSVFRASMKLSVIPETHLKQVTFSRFSLVYGGPPTPIRVGMDWSASPPPSSFQANSIAAVVPATPAQTLVAMRSSGETHIAVVRPEDDPTLPLPPLRTKRSSGALDFIRRKSRAALSRSATGKKPWDLLALAFPEVASTDWRANQSDRLAVKEVFVEWLHAQASIGGFARVPVLKSADVVTGRHVVLEGLTPYYATLSHKGIKYAAAPRLAPPPGLHALPTAVCAMQYVQRWLLVAAAWTNVVYLYDGFPSSTPAPRLLVRFAPNARIREMKFYGGFTSAPDEPPCAGKMVLAIVMEAGFVHICQFTVGDVNARVEWAVPAARKREGFVAAQVWRDEWSLKADGTMQG